MAGVRVHVVMPAELVAAVDAVLPVGVSRGEFVRRAVELCLAEARFGAGAVGEFGAVEQASEPPRAAERGFDPPAPAEQPEMRGLEPIVKNALGSGNAVEGVPPARPAARSHAPNCKCPVCS